MKTILKFFFPLKPEDSFSSKLLLVLRVLFGVLLLTHGLSKLQNIGTSSAFPDPIGLGSQLSFYLVVLAEFFCAIACILGLLHRFALIPIIINMAVAVFVVHGADPLSAKELGLIYLFAFAILYVTGPGKYSIDYFIAKKLHKK